MKETSTKNTKSKVPKTTKPRKKISVETDPFRKKYAEQIDLLRADLSAQLDAQNKRNAYCVSLVDDYINYWITKQKLFMDIEARGVTVITTTSTGVENTKSNDSIKSVTMITATMLKCLDTLGVKEPAAAETDDADYL